MNKHDRKCKRSCVSWIKGVLFGGISATILALLFAPKEGKQVRNKFHGFYNATSETSKNFFKYSQKQAKAFCQHTNALAKDISKEIKELAHSLLNEKE